MLYGRFIEEFHNITLNYVSGNTGSQIEDILGNIIIEHELISLCQI